ncbi:MAG: UvrB/UvrC motif-containing protein, partial [Gammaproteobacteria bacterium]
KEHGITPRGIQRAIHDIMEGARADLEPSSVKYLKVAEAAAKYETLSPQAMGKQIQQLEKQMQEHARNLEFEKAAQLRDEIRRLQAAIFGG